MKHFFFFIILKGNFCWIFWLTYLKDRLQIFFQIISKFKRINQFLFSLKSSWIVRDFCWFQGEYKLIRLNSLYIRMEIWRWSFNDCGAMQPKLLIYPTGEVELWLQFLTFSVRRLNKKIFQIIFPGVVYLIQRWAIVILRRFLWVLDTSAGYMRRNKIKLYEKILKLY